MKRIPSVLAVVGLLVFSSHGFAQEPAGEFQVTKITKNFITSPQYTYNGAQQYSANMRDRWLEVEVEFASTAPFTDEVTLKYYILFNGKVLTGEVTHTNVSAGRDNRSVMYVPPGAIARVMENRPVTPNAVQNIAIQIVQGGSVKDENNLSRATPQWYKGLPTLAGLVLNKNETPFAPLYWDRYEQIKSTR
ncbi:MAG TPA: Amuc_1102 family pilus-like protein [Chthoniobacterales bacterium]|nr:Amuc_1102 family pilus-like protein [Chthoniobacterales bacterium]